MRRWRFHQHYDTSGTAGGNSHHYQRGGAERRGHCDAGQHQRRNHLLHARRQYADHIVEQYQAPFLVASNLTVNAIAAASGDTSSSSRHEIILAQYCVGHAGVERRVFEFGTSANTLPSASNWTYDTGTDCCGNNEQETYCAAGSSTAPCNPPSPNALSRPTTAI